MGVHIFFSFFLSFQRRVLEGRFVTIIIFLSLFLRKRNSSKDETSEKATQVKIERDEANEKD